MTCIGIRARDAHRTLADRAALGLIVLSSALLAGAATRQALDMAGLCHEPLMEVAHSLTACELANVGLGVAILESLGARYAQRLGMVAKLLMTIEESALSIVAPRNRPLGGASLCLRPQ